MQIAPDAGRWRKICLVIHHGQLIECLDGTMHNKGYGLLARQIEQLALLIDKGELVAIAQLGPQRFRHGSGAFGLMRQGQGSGAIMTGEVFAQSLYRRGSEEHTSELQSLMRISYAVFCLKKKNIDREKN